MGQQKLGPLQWLRDLAQDTRYAIRRFRQSPGFTLVAVLTIALGIGANTAIFTLVHRVLLKTLPVNDPQQLVQLGCINPNEPGKQGCNTSYPGFLMYRDGNRVFSGIFAFAPSGQLNAEYNGSAELAAGILASGDFYQVLGVNPALGRLLNSADDERSAAPVAILSHAYWRRRFGGDSSVIGKTLRVNNHSVTVVGVTPASFRGVQLGNPPDLTLPIGSAAELFNGRGVLANGGNWWLRVIGRRKDGISLEHVRTDLEPIFYRTIDHMMASVPPAFASRIRDYVGKLRFRVLPAGVGAASEFRQELERPLRILMALVGLVLLIACVNLASLLLSRVAARRREFGVRLAIGAGRARLARQLLTESLVLSLAGGALGLMIAEWGGAVFLTMAAGETSLNAVDLEPDAAVFLFTGLVTVLVAFLLSLAPLLRLSKLDLQSALRDAGGRRGGSRIAHVLVPAQVALATILLIGAGLFVQTFENFRRLDMGFRSDSLVTFRVSPDLVGYSTDRTRAYLDAIVPRLEALPGVRSATYSGEAMGRINNTTLVDAPGFESVPPMQRSTARNHGGPRFIETAGLRLLRGRDFEKSDSPSGPRVAIVNESFARHFFGGIGAIGRRFGFAGQRETTYLVVGVVADARDRGPKSPTERVVYTASAQENLGSIVVTVRAEGSQTALMSSYQSVLREADPSVPVHGMSPVSAQIDEALSRERLLAILGLAFGGLALLLVVIGLYGLLASVVVRRTNEIGVRIALGASQKSVLWMVLRQGLVMVGAGMAAGVAAGVFLTRFVSSQLYGVNPNDPATFAGVAALLLVVTLVAALVPARRAARVDPIAALRYE